MQQAQDLQLTDPRFPKLQSGWPCATFSSPKDYYRMIHFDVADSISGEIPKRFNQVKFVLYAKCKELLISAANRVCVIAENLEAVKKHFGDDLEASRSSNQLGVLSDVV